MIAPIRAATIVVNNQAQFNAAIAVATQPGHADTVDASTAGAIDSGTTLTVPAAATSINLQFGTLGIGASVGNGTVTLGPTATVSFGQPGNPGTLNMGQGYTGLLNINGASVTFNVSDAVEQFNVGLDGGNGTVNMTSGTVTMNDSAAVPGNYGALSIGYPFGSTLANGTFNQSGGTVALSGGALNIGIANGNGTYNLSNNALLTLDGGTVYVGATSQGVGVLNISGDATLDFESKSVGFNGELFVGDDLGVGTITQNGANSTVILNIINTAQFGSNAAAGPSLGGTGTYNLLAGTLQIGGDGAAFGMAAGGVGFLNQSGGLLNATARIIIGHAGTGTYNMSGGTATLGAGLSIAELAGSIGTVNQTGGLVTISGGRLAVGTLGAATYNLNGGVLQAGGTDGVIGTGGLNLGGGTLQVINSALTTDIAIGLTGTRSTVDTDGLTATFGGVMSGVGGFVKAGLGTLTLAAANVYTGGTTISGGTLQIGNGGTTGSTVGNVVDNGTLAFDRSDAIAFGGAISGTGGLTMMGAGVLTLAAPGSYAGATLVNAGTLQAGAANVFSPNSAVVIAAGATLGLAGFNQTIGSLAGLGVVTLGAATLATGYDGSSTTFAGGISGLGGLTKIGGGIFVLSRVNSYSGATAVNGGTLEVDGAIANTSGVTVNSGGALSGTGIVDPATTTIMSGGTLAPGNGSKPTGTLAITGNLAFQSDALYLVQVTSTVAASTNVSGTAMLGGATVSAAFADGAYIAKQYTILTAAGGVSGAFAPIVTNTRLPANFSDTLSYDATHAYLDLALSFVPPSAPNFGTGLSLNQQAVGNALIDSFDATGRILRLYGTLTPAGLTQASGELATGSQQTTFDAMGLFMGLLTDPFMNRAGGASSAPGATGYAEGGDTGASAANRKTDAFAMFAKAPPAPFEQRWSAWAAGFGGSQTTDGNAAVGSNNTTSSIYGTAVGADYLFSPNTIAGFALAGGGTNFSVNGMGSGRSDLFQAGAYVRHTEGAAYISAALAYGWQDITTNRTVTIAGIDQLRAEFDANAYSGRIEGGYRFIAPWTGGVGITPYAAGQFTAFDLPAHAESVITGTPNFALAYAAKDVSDVRSELGIRTDKSFLMQDGVLTLRGRLAWAHDFDPDRSIAATFQALPSAGFVVNGAAQAHDSALTTTAIEIRWKSGWSAAATFEGEFSAVTSSYAGKGVVRYAW